jgi:hypothetical protein
MERRLFGDIISQKSDSGFFSATDLMRACNKWRICNNLSALKQGDYFKTTTDVEFIQIRN